jgi:hypothetical protein
VTTNPGGHCDCCGREVGHLNYDRDSDSAVCDSCLLDLMGVGKRIYRVIFRRQRDVDAHPDVDPARLPTTVYSTPCEHVEHVREDLAYVRSDEHPDTHEAWIETRVEPPWERMDD